MSGYEYKTVALPRLLKGPRARRQSASDFVSGVIEEVLNHQDSDGWEYLGAESFATPDRAGLFGRVETADFVVLVFRRQRETVEAVRRMMDRRGPPPSNAPAQAPAAYAAPAPAPATPLPSRAAGPMFKTPRAEGVGQAAPAAPRPHAPAPNAPRLDDEI